MCKHGISYSIFEKAAGERQREWGFTLHWSMNIIKSLVPDEVAEHLNEGSVDAYNNPDGNIFFRNGETGEPLPVLLPVPGAREMNHRKLRHVLEKNIDVKVCR